MKRRLSYQGGTRNILITGCSSGIGRCVAGGLRDRGWRVFASARRESDVFNLRGQGFDSVRLDLTDSQSIESALDWVLQQTGGRLEALFNNGAYGQPGALEDLPREALREQFETNLFGTHELTRRVLPIMRQQGGGRILQNSSILGFVAMPLRGAYVSSKFALAGLTETMRLEMRGSGIHFVLIEPGPIKSRFRENARKAFYKHINPEDSHHRDNYRGWVRKIEGHQDDAATRFTLPPEAVLAKVVKALESRHPRARYGVTFPTHLFWVLRCLLPRTWLDVLLAMGGR